MKKTLIITCLVFSIIGILIAASPFLLRLTGLDIPAKNFLISEIFGETEHHFDLQKIDIGLGSFEISEVSFVSADERLEVLIDQIVLDFNIIEFLKSPSTPKSSLREIYINQPQLIIHKKESLVRSTDSQKNNLVAIIAELDDYNSLRIHNGKIIYKGESGEIIEYAQNLNGWLNTTNENKIAVNVKGSAFSPDVENFKLDIELNSSTNTFTSRIDVLKYNFEHSIINQFIKDLSIKGTTDGYLKIDGDITKIDSVLVNGNIQLVNMAAIYNDESADNINLNFEIKNNSVQVKNGLVNYQNHPYFIDGYSTNVFDLQITGTIKSDKVPIASFKNYIPEQFFNGSEVNLKLKYKIDPHKYNITGQINSKDFSFYKTSFTDFKTSFIASNNGLQIPSIYASNMQMELNGSGIYKYDQSKLKLVLNGDYNSAEHILFDQISESNHKFNLTFDLNTSTGKSYGNWDYLLSKQDTILFADGEIGGDYNTIKAELLHSNFDSLKSKIKISDYLESRPRVDYALFENIPFHILSSDKILNGLFTSINTRAILSGYLNDFDGEVLVKDSASKDTIVTLTARIENLLSENKTAAGEVSLKHLNGEYEVDFNPTNLQSKFNLNDQIMGEFQVDLTNDDEQVNGNIEIDDFKILQAFFDAVPVNDYRYQGEIHGQVDIFGTLKDPKVKGKIFGEKFVLNDVGYFQPDIYFSLDRTSLIADSLKISHNNLEIITGNLSWALLSNQLFGQIKGSNLDVTTILNMLNVDNEIVSGNGAFDFKIKGTLTDPNIEADLFLSDGLLDSIKYDKLEISLFDEIEGNSDAFDFRNHKIELQKFYLARQGHYHLTSAGSLPLNSKDEIDLIVNFDGDILNLLPHWEPFFTNGASLTDMSLKFKGNIDDVRLVAMDINIDRGELWLKDVAPHIENISGKIELAEGANQVNMDIIAYVEDEYLKINTVRNINTAEGRELEDWYFRGIDLDFGILAMYTSGDGVNLNIPGLMENQEFGKIHLSGKTNEETFYFAGPVKHPVGYGIVTLNDALFTYPFITSKNPSKKPSTAVQFLSNMEWDATLKSGKDVLYIRDIPAYIDNVHAEINVDELSEGLKFKGIINEGTFKPSGSLVSTRGRLEYLDQNFKVDRFTLDFSLYKDLPDVSGRAWTTIRDSVGAVPKTIYLQLYAIDESTGQIKQSGNWSDFKFKLVSADPTEQETQEQVLSYLGYSVENIKEKATTVGGAITEKYLIRPLLRPLERVLEQGLGMDLVRFNSSIARNLFKSSVGKQFNSQSTNPLVNPYSNDVPYLYLMSSSEVTLGKYLNENLYLTYTGQLVSVYESTETGYDFNHSLGLEYKFYKNILLEFEWDRELMSYYNFENQRQYLEDFKVRLRHSFTF